MKTKLLYGGLAIWLALALCSAALAQNYVLCESVVDRTQAVFPDRCLSGWVYVRSV